MKKRNLTWAVMLIAALCISLTGCSSDNSPETPDVVTKPFTISASLGANNSRATVDYGTPDAETGELFKWNAVDKFLLMAKDANLNDIKNNVYDSKLHTFKIVNDYKDASSNSAKFTSEQGTFEPEGEFSYFTLYGGFVPDSPSGYDFYDYSIEGTQTQNGANTNHLRDYMYMYANGKGSSANGASLSFKHLTAMLRFTVKNANATDCKVKSITVTASANNVFGTKGEIAPNSMNYTQDPTITTSTSAATLTLNMSDYLLTANTTVDGYALTLPSKEALTDQKLTFTLTVTDADGSNERIYTSFVFSANKIGATTWEAGKRYWFDLTLDNQLTADIAGVADWGVGQENGETSSTPSSLTALCQDDTYKVYRQSLTTLTLDGAEMTQANSEAYMKDQFAKYFPNVTTVNITGTTLPYGYAFHKITQVTSINGESLISLPDGTFRGSNAKVANFNLPNVESVGGNCFKQCGVVTTLSLPKLTTIGNYAFSEIASLQQVCFASMTNFTSEYPMFKDSNNISDLALGTTQTMTFPSNVTISNNKVFGGSIYNNSKNVTLYLNEDGYEYKNQANLTTNTWRGITFKAIKKYSKYPYKKD